MRHLMIGLILGVLLSGGMGMAGDGLSDFEYRRQQEFDRQERHNNRMLDDVVRPRPPLDSILRPPC